MFIAKERTFALMGATIAIILVVLAVAQDVPQWLKWISMALGLIVLMLMVGGSGSTRLELFECRQKLRRALRQRDDLDRYFTALMDYVPSNIYFKDRESRFLQVNHSMVEALGAESAKDMIGKTDSDYFGPEHAGAAREDEIRIIERGEGIEKYIEKETFPNGDEGWVLSSKLPFRDKDGRILGTFGISSDVTELIRTQQSLEMERNTLRTLLDSIPDSIYIRDAEGRYLVVNRALADMVGVEDPQKVAGMTPYDFFPEEEARGFLEEDLQLMKEGVTVVNPIRMVKNLQGEVRHLSTTKVPVRDRAGNVSGILGINRDVTEQERAREAVKQTEHRMQEIVDNSPSPMYAKSETGHYLMVNRRYEELFNLKAEEVVGKTDIEILGNEDIVRRLQKNDALVFERGEPVQFDEVLKLADGERAYVSVKFPMRDLDGQIYAVGGISTDITERKKAEQALQELNQELMQTHENLTRAHEQLIQAEKMESVGRLAAGVAHEVKNPLAMIGMGLELLARRMPEDDEKARETIERMKRGIDRAKKIVRGLVDYSSDRRLEMHPISPNLLVTDALELIEYQLTKSGISVSFEADETLPDVEGDQTKVEQVLVNLFINAMHSMDEGGDLKITTELISMDNVIHDEGSRLRERMRKGDRFVKIIVEDSGKGIPEEVLGKLFDPFFTTKATGKGTGLGLTVSRKIAELHGGDLVLMNRPDGKGAMAVLSLRVAN
ncbi:PAS domain-containing protein [Luteolibacter algae]|uniref:histidine kinase n=1 Tax=Luteolibacter algae TaxID=454151 RepID=A0ABW5DB46_9BACT